MRGGIASALLADNGVSGARLPSSWLHELNSLGPSDYSRLGVLTQSGVGIDYVCLFYFRKRFRKSAPGDFSKQPLVLSAGPCCMGIQAAARTTDNPALPGAGAAGCGSGSGWDRAPAPGCAGSNVVTQANYANPSVRVAVVDRLGFSRCIQGKVSIQQPSSASRDQGNPG